jgi:hypothetical protein
MTYSIFVSLEEFLANGGVLKAGRELFQVSSSAGASPIPIQVGWFDENLQTQLNGHSLIMIKNHSWAYPTGKELVFVKCNCTPIYL